MRGTIQRLGRGVRVARWAMIVLAYAVLLGAGAFAGMCYAALDELPEIERSPQFRKFEGKVVARDGTTVLRTLRAPETRRYAQVHQIPTVLEQAVVAAEDRRFQVHPGIDPRAIVRAIWIDLRTLEKREGASTLTQQFVKNAYVGPERSFARKTREAVLAVLVDATWSKDRIMTAYLNTAYFGEGAYGITDAADTYFGVRPGDLNLEQSALLAGVLRSPATDNPFVSPQNARTQRGIVLRSMQEEGHITEAQRAAAARAPLPTRARRAASAQRELAPHFVDNVVGQLISEYGTSTALGSGLTVTTTLDAPMQRAARDAVARIDGTGLSAAIVVIDPRTGELRALALGGPAADGAFDVATAGQRQPGSAFKPFALSVALERGYTPETLVLSAPFREEYPGVGEYEVTNSSGLYAGRQPLRQATWFSDNTVYARIAHDVGIEAIIGRAYELGIQANLDPVPATILGGLSEGVSPLEMAQAYSVFAAHGAAVGGSGHRPLRIRSVSDHSGRQLARYSASQIPVLDRLVADQVTDVLQGVVSSGTGTAAAIGRPAAGKTGTTDNNVDAWFVGYTPQLVAAVWVGHVEGSIPMRSEYHGGSVSGGTYPAEIWGAFMSAAHAGLAVRPFQLKRPRYVTVFVDPRNGRIADRWCKGARRERYLEGSEPTAMSEDCPSVRRAVPDVLGLPVDEARALLEAEDFMVEEERVSSDEAAGTVVEQAPGPGDRITREEPVVLSVARGAGETGTDATTSTDGSTLSDRDQREAEREREREEREAEREAEREERRS